MSISQEIRSFLAKDGTPVPPRLLEWCDQVDNLFLRAEMLCDAADPTGCAEGAVVDDYSYQSLVSQVDALRIPTSQYVVAANDMVLVTIRIRTDDGLDDPFFDEAVISDTGEPCLVDDGELHGAKAVAFQMSYPSARKYGVPDCASRKGAVDYLCRMGFVVDALYMSVQSSDDDSGDVMFVSVMLPKGAVALASLDEAKEFAGVHWRKHFESVSREEQRDLVSRYVQAINT